MFLTEENYNETINLMVGRKEPSLLLKDLIDWAKDSLQINVFNYICDDTDNGLRRLRLVLWDYEAAKKIHDGPNYDKKKQSQVAKNLQNYAVPMKCIKSMRIMKGYL